MLAGHIVAYLYIRNVYNIRVPFYRQKKKKEKRKRNRNTL